VEELPDYAKLNSDENLKKLLEQKIEGDGSAAPQPTNPIAV
jgi:hypothetical protein